MRIRPVVGDLARVVVAHHVRAAAVMRAVRIVAVLAPERAVHRRADEPVHGTVVDVAPGVEPCVGAAEVVVVEIVVRPDAATARIGYAHARWNPVSAGKGSEVGVEGSVLLHDHDNVLDLVNARASRQGSRAGRGLRVLAELAGESAQRERKSRNNEDGQLQGYDASPFRVGRPLTFHASTFTNSRRNRARLQAKRVPE